MIRWIRSWVWTPVRRTVENWSRDDGPQLAAAVSYYMALSFFPLVLILLSATGFVLRFTGWGRSAQEQILHLIRDQTSPSLAAQVKTMLDTLQMRAEVGGPVGLVILLAAAIMIFTQFDKAFDQIWRVSAKREGGLWAFFRNVFWDRLRAFLMLLGVGLFLVVGFVASMAFAAARSRLQQWVPLSGSAWHFIGLMPAVALNWLLFAAIYKVVPKAPVRWSEAAGGALLAAILWEVGRRVLASLIIGTKYSAYGVVGAFIAIMLWVYYAASTVFLGAEFIQVLRQRGDPDAARSGRNQ